MNTVKNIAKNSTVYIVGQVISKILGVIFGIYLIRYLIVADYGKLSLATTLIALAGMFIYLGLTPLTIREVARDKTKIEKYFNGMLNIRIIAAFIVAVLILVVPKFMGYSQDTIKLIYIIGLAGILGGVFNGSFVAIFRACEKLEYETFVTILSTAIYVSGGLALIYLRYGIFEIAKLTLAITCLQIVINFWLYTKKIAKIRVYPDFGFASDIFKKAIPFYLAYLAGAFLWKIDIVMLSMIQGETAVGFYTVPVRLTDALMILGTGYSLATYPVLSRYFVEANRLFRIGYEKSMKLFFIIGIPIAIGTTLLSKRIIYFFFTPKYMNSVPVLQILIWFSSLWLLRSITAHILRSMGKEKIDLYANVVALALNIGLNLILIPLYSYIGAAIATVVCEALLVTTEFYAIATNGYRLRIDAIVVKPLVAALLMGGVVYYFNYLENVNLAVIILLAAASYFGLLLLLKTFSMKEFEMAKRIFVSQEKGAVSK